MPMASTERQQFLVQGIVLSLFGLCAGLITHQRLTVGTIDVLVVN